MDVSEAISRIRPAVRVGQAYRVSGPVHASVKLNQNESPFDLPEDLKREIITQFWDDPFNRYPQVQPIALQQALAAALGWDAEGVLVGNGSNELMATVFQVLVSPGTGVVLPDPMFSLYARLATLFEATLVTVPSGSDLRFDARAIRHAAHTCDAGLVVLTSPNSPTGLAMPLADVHRVLEAAPGFVLVDEAYVEFSREESPFVLLQRYPNLLLLRTFSKAFGLAGLRIGYLVGHPAVMQEVMKARIPFMVDRLSEMVALALLARPALIEERIAYLRRATAWLYDALFTIPGVQPVAPQTNFVLFRTPMVPGALLQALLKRGVLVRNMSSYEALPGYLRVSAGTEAENKLFIQALTSVLR